MVTRSCFCCERDREGPAPTFVFARQRVWPPDRLVIERRGVRDLRDVAAVGVGSGDPFLAGSWGFLGQQEEDDLLPSGG